MEEETLWSDNTYIKRLLDLDVSKGEGKKCTRVGKARRTHNQELTGTVSMKTLEWLLKRRAEQLWDCPNCHEAGF